MATRVRLNLKAVNQIMKSPGVAALLRERAEAIARDAGAGFEAASDNSHPWVARAWVRAETNAAKRAEASQKVLTKALGRAG
jgi:hypothetical protein